MEDCEGKRFLFEVYSETNATVKGCKTDSKGTVVQGHHKTYKYYYFVIKLHVIFFVIKCIFVAECPPVVMRIGPPGCRPSRTASRSILFMTLSARKKRPWKENRWDTSTTMTSLPRTQNPPLAQQLSNNQSIQLFFNFNLFSRNHLIWIIFLAFFCPPLNICSPTKLISHVVRFEILKSQIRIKLTNLHTSVYLLTQDTPIFTFNVNKHFMSVG